MVSPLSPKFPEFCVSNNTPLCLAVQAGDLKKVSLLLEGGANPNCENTDRDPVLCVAIENGNKELISLLLEAGANPNVKNRYGKSLLYLAAGNEEIVSLLMSAGADPSEDIRGAFASKDIRIISLAIREMDINFIDDQGFTPIHRCVQNGYFKAFSMLLQKGANLEVRNNKGYSVVHTAARKGNLAALSLLLGRGMDPNPRDCFNYTPLHHAASKEQGGSFTALVLHGAKIDVQDDLGYTPFHFAAAEGRIKVLKEVNSIFCKNLGKNGLNAQLSRALEIQDVHGCTPLYVAIIEEKIGFASLLLDLGVNPNIGTKKGKAPLHMAVRNGDISKTFVLKLLSCGADPNMRDAKGRVPLHEAHEKFTSLLLEHGAIANISDKKGDTPLHHAATKGKKTFSTLLRKGAESHPNLEGITPFDLALMQNVNMLQKCILLLLQDSAFPVNSYLAQRERNLFFHHQKSKITNRISLVRAVSAIDTKKWKKLNASEEKKLYFQLLQEIVSGAYKNNLSYWIKAMKSGSPKHVVISNFCCNHR